MANNLSDCFCSLADLLGGAKGQVVASIDTLVSLLSVLKAYLQMINLNVQDEAKKVALELALQILQEAGNTVEQPFTVAIAYTGILSDCPPVASLAAILKAVKEIVLGPLDNLEFQIKQYIASLEDKRLQLETIDRWIRLLNEARDKLELCGS